MRVIRGVFGVKMDLIEILEFFTDGSGFLAALGVTSGGLERAPA
jgi:hypothetical protein